MVFGEYEKGRKMELTIAMTTSRPEPNFHWTLDSLMPQLKHDDKIHFLLIDLRCSTPEVREGWPKINVAIHPIKPTVWQGAFKLTAADWWAKCNALNTAFCLCKTDWIAFLDDRCVLANTWLQSVKDAIAGNYVVAGQYEKWHDLKIENGVILERGIKSAEDCRSKKYPAGVTQCPGDELFGCTYALPLEWALSVNGASELLCDSCSMEDTVFGRILENNGYPIKYDSRMLMIEDRTPGQLGEPMKRTSKRRYDFDKEAKDFKILEKVRTMKRSENAFGDIRELRAKILAGGKFAVLNRPSVDWFDQMPVTDFDKI